MASDRAPDEPIDEDVPLADAVEQQLEVDEPPSLSEDFEPTAVNEIGTEVAPEDANPADWQEQRTAAADGWDPDIDL